MNTPTNQVSLALCSFCSDVAEVEIPDAKLNLCLVCAANLVTEIVDRVEEVLTGRPPENTDQLPTLTA